MAKLIGVGFSSEFENVFVPIQPSIFWTVQITYRIWRLRYIDSIPQQNLHTFMVEISQVSGLKGLTTLNSLSFKTTLITPLDIQTFHYYHPANHHHIRSHVFTDRKNVQQADDPQHDIEAVYHVTCTARGRVKSETNTNKKRHHCEAVKKVPLTGGPFFEFVA